MTVCRSDDARLPPYLVDRRLFQLFEYVEELLILGGVWGGMQGLLYYRDKLTSGLGDCI